MAGGRIGRTYNLLVRVEAGNGLVGRGEAASAPLMTGDVLPGMITAVNNHLAPPVIGQDTLRRARCCSPCSFSAISRSRTMLRAGPGRGGQRKKGDPAACETAQIGRAH